MEQYLRPDSLFRPTKFDSYVNYAKNLAIASHMKRIAVAEPVEAEPELTDEEWLKMMEKSDVL
jgi:hypothetical protein